MGLEGPWFQYSFAVVLDVLDLISSQITPAKSRNMDEHGYPWFFQIRAALRSVDSKLVEKCSPWASDFQGRCSPLLRCPTLDWWMLVAVSEIQTFFGGQFGVPWWRQLPWSGGDDVCTVMEYHASPLGKWGSHAEASRNKDADPGIA